MATVALVNEFIHELPQWGVVFKAEEPRENEFVLVTKLREVDQDLDLVIFDGVFDL